MQGLIFFLESIPIGTISMEKKWMIISLDIQNHPVIPPKKVLVGIFFHILGNPTTFSAGVWMSRPWNTTSAPKGCHGPVYIGSFCDCKFEWPKVAGSMGRK